LGSADMAKRYGKRSLRAIIQRFERPGQAGDGGEVLNVIGISTYEFGREGAGCGLSGLSGARRPQKNPLRGTFTYLNYAR